MNRTKPKLRIVAQDELVLVQTFRKRKEGASLLALGVFSLVLTVLLAIAVYQ